MEDTAAAAPMSVLYRFELRGRHLRHSWKKKCLPEAAVLFAMEEAREYAKDAAYRGLSIRVLDERGNEVTRVPIAEQP